MTSEQEAQFVKLMLHELKGALVALQKNDHGSAAKSVLQVVDQICRPPHGRWNKNSTGLQQLLAQLFSVSVLHNECHLKQCNCYVG